MTFIIGHPIHGYDKQRMPNVFTSSFSMFIIKDKIIFLLRILDCLAFMKESELIKKKKEKRKKENKRKRNKKKRNSDHCAHFLPIINQMRREGIGRNFRLIRANPGIGSPSPSPAVDLFQNLIGDFFYCQFCSTCAGAFSGQMFLWDLFSF